MRIISVDMCGRFTLTSKLEDLLRQFQNPVGEIEYGPRYNIAPTQSVLTVGAERGYALQYMRWGLVPDWAVNKKNAISLINARTESILTNGTYSNSLSDRRCLIIADGYYEWRLFEGRKVPFWIGLKGFKPFAFAGLWNESQLSKNGSLTRSCAIVTCVPNRMLGSLHSRMPVILRENEHSAWLSQDHLELNELARILQPYPSEKMELHEVSQSVNSVKNDCSELVRAIHPPR
jgi:putative SOS response-associated peptidase YedK